MNRRKIIFPDVETANEEGLVAVGGDLEIDTLLTAYEAGIFPWPISTWPLNAGIPNTWFSPNPRGVIDLNEIHLPKSFSKFIKKHPLRVTFNQAFEAVIRECAATPRKNQPGTWITPDIIEAYIRMFKEGYAYSVEVWDEHECLVGGLYGVTIDTFISGESMFTKEDNASKYGLYVLLKHLESKGITWMDTQMVTPVVEHFGGKYIPRELFLERLKQVQWDQENRLF